MPHPTLTLDRSATRRLWEAFVAGRDVDLSALPPVISASWARSRARGASPDLARAPSRSPVHAEALSAIATPWLASAEPAFALLRAALAEAHQVVLLTDLAGRVLLCHVGDKAR